MADRRLAEAPTDEDEQRRTHRLKLDRLEAEDIETDIALKKRFANSAVLLMFGQILVSDAVFIWYGDTNGWDVPPGVIGGWLGATTIQIFSVVLVITEYLFPSDSRRRKKRQ